MTNQAVKTGGTAKAEVVVRAFELVGVADADPGDAQKEGDRADPEGRSADARPGIEQRGENLCAIPGRC